MAIISGPQRWWIDSNPTFAAKQAVVQDNLLLNLDAGVSSSYSGSGTTWYNLKGTGNNAIKYGPTYSSSVGNGSFLFDGDDDRFECGSIAGLDTYNQLTAEVWVRFTSMTADDGDNSFVIQAGENSLTFDFLTTSNNYLRFRMGGGQGTIYTSSTISTNVWYHFVGTFNDSTMKFYRNNVLQGTTTRNQTLPSSLKLDLGRYRNAFSGFPSSDSSQLNGYLSTVRIYNKALTATEVSQNFNVYKARFGL